MCKVLNVSRSGFYVRMEKKPSKRVLENQKITQQIRLIHQQSDQTYGSPRIREELKNKNINVSRPRVARLMKKAQIQSKIRKKFVVTTDSKHHYPIVENKLNRDFQADRMGKAWVSDITYIRTAQGWLYLTIIMDLADRKVIGWSLSESMKASETSMAAWRMAIKNRALTADLIFHSDRGIQYACTEFQNLLEANKQVIRSMSRKGDCWDNAVAETFFKTLKVELVYRRKYSTRAEAAVSIFEYIETRYNRTRLHSTLGYRSPEEFGRLLLQNKLVA